MDPDFRLTQAVLDNKINEVKKLLKDKSININEQDIENNTPLMYACEEGMEDIVKLLVKAGADLNIQNSYGETALRKVDSPDSISIAKDITRYLIEHGANPHLKEKHTGYTALIDSTTKEIYVKYLVDKVKKKISFAKIMMNDKEIPDDIIKKILSKLDNSFKKDKQLINEIVSQLKKSTSKSTSKKTGSKKTKKNSKKPIKSKKKPKKSRKKSK